MESWLQGITACLAIYGLFALGSTLWRRAKDSLFLSPKATPVSILLMVKNKERVIEGIIRCLLSATLGSAAAIRDYELIVVDDRSADQTPAILERLARQYGCLKLVRMDRLQAAGKSAAEVGLFLCRNQCTLVCNLTGAADTGALLDTIAFLFGEKVTEEARQEGVD